MYVFSLLQLPDIRYICFRDDVFSLKNPSHQEKSFSYASDAHPSTILLNDDAFNKASSLKRTRDLIFRSSRKSSRDASRSDEKVTNMRLVKWHDQTLSLLWDLQSRPVDLGGPVPTVEPAKQSGGSRPFQGSTDSWNNGFGVFVDARSDNETKSSETSSFDEEFISC
ncbi:hypothetical protein Tco_1137791 [Tanacetum coccineum]